MDSADFEAELFSVEFDGGSDGGGLEFWNDLPG
mgnify:CR=1 FL=1